MTTDKNIDVHKWMKSSDCCTYVNKYIKIFSHGQRQRGVGLMMRGKCGWGVGEGMGKKETTVLETP